MSMKSYQLNSDRLLMDNAAYGFGYMPRPGIDVPSGAAGYSMPYLDAEVLYMNNSIAKNIVDMPAEDLVRNGWKIVMEDENLANDLTERLNDLNAKEAIKKMFQYQRLYGAGAVFIGVDELDAQPDNPLATENLDKLTYLSPFSRKKMSTIEYSEDVTSPDYGKVSKLSLDGTYIDPTRFLFANGFMFENEMWGRNVLETMMPELDAASTAINSVDKMLDDFVFKVYKSPDADGMSQDDKQLVGMVANHQFKTDAMAILTSDESLEHEAKPVTGIHELLDYSWERIAAAARMPKSIIMGQETGTLTGAQYDLMNYYARIAAMQESELRPHLEYLVRLLLWAKNEPGGQIDPDSIDWHVTFNPLYELDSQTDADVRLKQAQADNIYLTTGVLSAEDVKEQRFGVYGVNDQRKMNADSADIVQDEAPKQTWFQKIVGK
ncbi:MAG: anti-CBASS protein Acb1 family protein [Weissella confusa]